MAKKDMTAGERLCTFIRREVLSADLWTHVATSLAPVARSAELTGFFEEVASVHLTGRLVMGGRDISEEVGSVEEIASEEFEQLYLGFVRETTELSGRRRKEVEARLVALGSDAVRAARKSEIPSGVAKAVRRFAETKHRYCYLCGRSLNFATEDTFPQLTAEERKLVYEAEHVWPQSYGGDSDEDNLLPACSSCNRAKDNYPTWAMVDVQSISLGINPRREVLDRLSGTHRFALLSRAALGVANTQRISLKEAYMEVGPGVSPRVMRVNDAADFFNMDNIR